MKDSIFETQSFCIVIETCTYLSIVKATVACPRLLETVFTSTPFCKAWCKEHSIAFKTYYNWERQIVKAATQQYALPAPSRTGVLMQIEPDQLPNAETGRVNTGIVIHHGESAIILPAGSSAEAVADVVKALNRHA